MAYAIPRTGLVARDLDDTPDDGLRRELHDGVIYVVPPPSDDHNWVSSYLHVALARTAPDGVYVFENAGVHIGGGRLYVPDVLVVRRDARYHDNGYEPGGVLLVAEVVSRSSETLDRITKPLRYAENDIPYFWRVDPGPRLVCQRISGPLGPYETVAEGGPGDMVTLTEPWAVTLAVDELVMPHKR